MEQSSMEETTPPPPPSRVWAHEQLPVSQCQFIPNQGNLLREVHLYDEDISIINEKSFCPYLLIINFDQIKGGVPECLI